MPRTTEGRSFVYLRFVVRCGQYIFVALLMGFRRAYNAVIPCSVTLF